MSESPPANESANTKTSRGRSCLGMIAVVMVYLFLSAILFILPTGFIGPVFAIGGFFFVIVLGLHYIVWGKWVSKLIAEDQQDEDQST